jgi:17 kDa outer membrane surface antigen
MAGPVAGRTNRLPLYSGTAVTSLRLGVSLGVILACGLMASGCAVSGGMGNLFAKGKASDAPVQGNVQASALTNEEVTGSTNAPTLRASAAVATSGLPSETDLVFARMAIVEVLKRGSKEASAPWENPSSGARGTVTPIANAYARDGATCHDFLASYIRRGSPESWMQGQACRAGKRDVWEVRSLRPWTRS